MRVENTTVIGRKLREWRARNNMTQKKTAQKLFCNVSSLINWERGKTVPDYYFVKAIHDMTGYKYEDLFEG